MSVLAAIGRGEVANYVDALFTVYLILIIGFIVLGWIQMFRPIPYNVPLRAVTGFIEETVRPYLNIFRRLIPPIGGPGMGIDLSPMIGIILLFIVQSLVVGTIRG